VVDALNTEAPLSFLNGLVGVFFWFTIMINWIGKK
jgi:hypothetical protein